MNVKDNLSKPEQNIFFTESASFSQNDLSALIKNMGAKLTIFGRRKSRYFLR